MFDVPTRATVLLEGQAGISKERSTMTHISLTTTTPPVIIFNLSSLGLSVKTMDVSELIFDNIPIKSL